MPTPARSLADDLRSRADENLAELLVRRPDLARPAPADLTTLAARATTRSSVQRALDGLDLARLRTLEAVVVAGPAQLEELARLLGEPVSTIDPLLDDLCGLALCWRSAEGIRAARTVAEVVGDPAGLGPVLPDVPAGADLDHLSRQERAVLEALAWGPPTGVLSAGAGDRAVATAGSRLVEAGLLHRIDAQHVVLPRQVALVLRGGRLHREPGLHPPQPQGQPLDPGVVDAAAGGRAAELLGHVAEVLDDWSARPPRVLRGGGLAVRDLGRLAARLEIDTAEAAWLLETMLAAGLIASDDAADPAWMPTGEADDWSEQPAEQRWAELAGAWLSMPAAPSLVGSKDTAGRVNVLTTSWPAGRQRRTDTIRALATLPVGSAPTEPELTALVRWHHPLRLARTADPGIAVVLREAEWAGMTGRGALSSPGRALLEDGPAAELMAPHLPVPVEHVLIQADLTAIAPGRLEGPARSVMRLVSDVESRGGATVHRFSEASVRRALDLGWTADRVLTEIAAVSSTGVPQPLDYLVRDVARRHGVARVGPVGCYVRSDDAALLDRMLADKALALLQLRRIAPTVVVSPVPAPTVLDVLREEQYGPVAESVDGGMALAPASHHRTSRRGFRPVQVHQVDAATATRIVTSMRSGERGRTSTGVSAHGAPPPTDPAVTAEVLREAALEGLAVWIGYADDAGGVQRLLLWPDWVEAGRMRARVEGQQSTRSFLLHRITGAHVAD